MNILNLRRRLARIPARVSGAVHLGTMVTGPDLAFELMGTFEDFNEESFKTVFPGVDEETAEAIIEHGEGEALDDVVRESGRWGWVVKIEVPIFDDMGVGHWGQYTWRHFYGDEYEAAVEAGIAWTLEHKRQACPSKTT